MFGLFRRKPKYTAEQMFEQLGKVSMGITSAASETENLFIAIKGAAVVSAIIKEGALKNQVQHFSERMLHGEKLLSVEY